MKLTCICGKVINLTLDQTAGVPLREVCGWDLKRIKVDRKIKWQTLCPKCLSLYEPKDLEVR